MRSTYWYWVFASIITLGAMVYQRSTGPTNPKRIKYEINGSKQISTFPRSGNSGTNCEVELKNIPSGFEASIIYRRFPTNDEWSRAQFSMENHKLAASLPSQPAAGKLEYFIEIKNTTDNSITNLSKDEPIVIRFKDSVPAWALIPHIILMFIAMLLSNLTGAMAIFYNKSYKFYGILTIITLFLGGFVFGPIVQHYAFGQAWTGFP